jgi:penicillin-binding protein 2
VKGIHELRIAGKTGTAALSARSGAWSKVNTSWFAGFAPHNKPRFAFAVMVHRAATSGADAAAPLAVAMLKALKSDPEFASAWD